MVQCMKSGVTPPAQIEKELITLISSISIAVLPVQEIATGSNKMNPTKQIRLAEAGRVALSHNLVNIADSITNYLSRVRQLDQRAYILDEYNKAELYIKKAGPLIDDKTGMRLNSIQIKQQEIRRRIEALKILDKSMTTNRKLNDPELIYEGALLIWNVSLPFINSSYRDHLSGAFTSASDLLEQIQSHDHALRVNFHLEIAKTEMQDGNFLIAERNIRKALALDYSIPLNKVNFCFI